MNERFERLAEDTAVDNWDDCGADRIHRGCWEAAAMVVDQAKAVLPLGVSEGFPCPGDDDGVNVRWTSTREKSLVRMVDAERSVSGGWEWTLEDKSQGTSLRTHGVCDDDEDMIARLAEMFR